MELENSTTFLEGFDRRCHSTLTHWRIYFPTTVPEVALCSTLCCVWLCLHHFPLPENETCPYIPDYIPPIIQIAGTSNILCKNFLISKSMIPFYDILESHFILVPNIVHEQ